MKIKTSEIGDIGEILTLSYNWKGCSFNDETNSWIKDNDLHKDGKGNLYPFCSTVPTNDVVKIFESAPINENNILIIRGNISDIFVVAYILVGSVNIENYKFETKLL